MSKPDATEAFDIYKSFIKQTDKVVDYLGVVRKLHNIVNVPVPNLKHAPTSLVKALEEYLHDPNFEENRREYKASLGVVEGKPAQRTPSPNRESLPSTPLLKLITSCCQICRCQTRPVRIDICCPSAILLSTSRCTPWSVSKNTRLFRLDPE